MTSEYDKTKRKSGRDRHSSGKLGGERENPFVNVSLSEEQNAQKRSWLADRADLFDVAQELIEAEYAISIKWDDYSGSPAVFLRPPDGHGENDGLVLTGRGGTVASALRECLFIHNVVLEGNWRNAKPRSVRDFSDDDF